MADPQATDVASILDDPDVPKGRKAFVPLGTPPGAMCYTYANSKTRE